MTATLNASSQSIKVVEEIIGSLSQSAQKLTGEEVVSHISDICQGLRCSFDDLPGQIGVIAEAARRRGQSFMFDRTGYSRALRELHSTLTTT